MNLPSPGTSLKGGVWAGMGSRQGRDAPQIQRVLGKNVSAFSSSRSGLGLFCPCPCSGSSSVLATRLLAHWRKAKYLGSITPPPSSLSEVEEGRHAPETFWGLEEAHTRVPGSRQVKGNHCQDPLNCTCPSLLWKPLRVYQAHRWAAPARGSLRSSGDPACPSPCLCQPLLHGQALPSAGFPELS